VLYSAADLALAYAVGSSACFAFRFGPTISDTQMMAFRITFWCVDTNICVAKRGWPTLDLDVHRSFPYGTRPRPAFGRPPICSTCFRVLEAVHQAFVCHVTWFYVVEWVSRVFFFLQGHLTLSLRVQQLWKPPRATRPPSLVSTPLISAHACLPTRPP
jgi:hypothetical protein